LVQGGRDDKGLPGLKLRSKARKIEIELIRISIWSQRTKVERVFVGKSRGSSPPIAWTDVENNGTLNQLPNRQILRILIDPADSNAVYVALAGYTLGTSANFWRTTDGGSTWAAISGSGMIALRMVPVRAIARHPRNQQRLYVGTDIGIYETEDGGSTWNTSNEGPADVAVDELIFLPASETLLAATHGRGLWTADTSAVPTFAPANASASATKNGATWSVNITWSVLTGATAYRVYRSYNGAAYTLDAEVLSTSFSENVAAGITYFYKVKAKVNQIWTDFSNVDLATTVEFTDDNALTGKVIKALHVNEMRTAVNAVLASASLAHLTGSSVPIGAVVRLADITPLRTALTSAYAAITKSPAPLFTAVTQFVTPVRAVHYQEIRNAVK
jgi:hypothetical protein